MANTGEAGLFRGGIEQGVPPDEPAKWAPYEMAIKPGGRVDHCVVDCVHLLGHLEYETWSAIGGVTVWCKFFASFGLSRQAHLKLGRNMDKKGSPSRASQSGLILSVL